MSDVEYKAEFVFELVLERLLSDFKLIMPGYH